MITFQKIISRLQDFWTENGCILQQSYDLRTGAGTFHPDTFLRSQGEESYNVCHVQSCIRPTDGRYGQNPNRLQRFHQFQVMVKPSPKDMQNLYLRSLEAIGLCLKTHDIRFIHDDWESPTQGAWGLGWEVWCDGMEITQFTYFQSMGGFVLNPIPAELAYGLERIAMFLQGVDNIYDIQYTDNLRYGEVFLQSEIENSHYNFELADSKMWLQHFIDYENEAKKLLDQGYPIPAYDFIVQASHAFNLLDARSAISTASRVDFMHRIKHLASRSAEIYLASREKLGFPLKESVSLEKSPPKPFSATKDSHLDFLLEIGSEELPASFIPEALIGLEAEVKNFLKKHDLSYKNLSVYGSPRRLAISITDLLAKKDAAKIEKKGPPINRTFDDKGLLTKQGAGFFSSIGYENITLKEVESGKHSNIRCQDNYVFVTIETPCTYTGELLQTFLPKLLEKIPFPKRMRWGYYPETYARPIHWIIALLGKTVIDFSYAGVNTNNVSYGHRQRCFQPVTITEPSEYLQKLKSVDVLVNISERREFIENQMQKLLSNNQSIVQKERVLSEVIHLSEYPTLALTGFDQKFLDLPDELLVSEMIQHQRYFPVQENGKLISQFIVAVDKEPNPTIQKNNRAVLSARFSDAVFLFSQDRKISLEEMGKKLEKITFHPEIGSMQDKVHRIEKLSEKLSSLLCVENPERAAKLCKADLASEVIYEFPELQGIMGRIYAGLDKEKASVCQAIEEHWWPIMEGGQIPQSSDGAIIALADKLDSFISFMQIGIKPTSSKDPYGLRRCAIGVIRILIEKKWFLPLSLITQDKEVLAFFKQRLKNILLEDYEFTKKAVDSVLSLNLQDPFDIFCRVQALTELLEKKETFQALQEIFKRARGQIHNVSAKPFNPDLLQESHERHLSKHLGEIEPKIDHAILLKDYRTAFSEIASLAKPLENFFTHVHILTDDSKLRDNRLALLQNVLEQTQKMIDLTHF